MVMRMSCSLSLIHDRHSLLSIVYHQVDRNQAIKLMYQGSKMGSLVVCIWDLQVLLSA